MPILTSGRAAGIQPKNFIDEVVIDENGELQEITFGYRPQVNTPDDLLNLLPVMYFDVQDGIPVMESMRNSGFSFGEIAAGADSWSSAEVNELRAWAQANAGLQQWLAEHLAAIKRQAAQDDTGETPVSGIPFDTTR